VVNRDSQRLFRNIKDLVRSDIVPICDRCGDVVEYDDHYDRYWCLSCASFCLPLFQHALPLFYEMFAQWFSGVKKGGARRGQNTLVNTLVNSR